jgi:phospholipid-transporting ATPase
MVPISLLVTVEIVKFAQALFISWDINIYDTERDMPTRVQSSNLNEELGQISHIFSDKTGTLTSNVMQFRRFSAGMTSYGGPEPTAKSERSSSAA